MQQISLCFDKVKKDCFKFLKSQETKADKFINKEKMIRTFLIPICFWINKKVDKKQPYFFGLAGGQGTGKTTISSLIKIILTKYFDLKVFRISIDDFYKTRKERINLSKRIHPMLLTRGVPGTHDINMMLSFFKKIKINKFKSIILPTFNKAIDDRFKKKYWYTLKNKPDVIIFEGWCVGAKAQKNKDLKNSLNFIEKTYDKNMKWRKYVNNQLKTNYKLLFKQLDGLLYLKPKNFNSLKNWRIKQERKLWEKNKNKKNLRIMNTVDLSNFMQTYQRITQQMFKDCPKISSIMMKLNSRHQITNIIFKKR